MGGTGGSCCKNLGGMHRSTRGGRGDAEAHKNGGCDQAVRHTNCAVHDVRRKPNGGVEQEVICCRNLRGVLQ